MLWEGVRRHLAGLGRVAAPVRKDPDSLLAALVLYTVFDHLVCLDFDGVNPFQLVALPILVAAVVAVRTFIRRFRDVYRFTGPAWLVLVGFTALLGFIFFPLALWINEPRFFLWHSSLVLLWILTVLLIRSRMVSMLATVAIASLVLFLQADRPEYEIWRSAGPWVLLVVWSAIRTSRPIRRLERLLVVVALSAVLGQFQLLQSRYLAPTEARILEMQAQDDVEVLFDNGTSDRIPAHRMEVLCSRKTGSLYVTPHDLSRSLAEITDTGEIRSSLMPTELADQSLIDSGILYTSIEGDLAAVDIETRRILYQIPICEDELYYIDMSPDRKRLTVSCEDDLQLDRWCVVLDRRGDRWIPEPETYRGGECVFAGNRRLMVGPLQFADVFRMSMRLVDLGTRKVVKEAIEWPAWPFGPYHEVYPDLGNRRLYFPRMATGEILVYDLDTLEPRAPLRAEAGVRGVLVDEGDATRVFSWNYVTGLVHEHRLPGGEITRSWDVGPVVRKVNWDCDRRSLLVASDKGGFRIHL